MENNLLELTYQNDIESDFQKKFLQEEFENIQKEIINN
jgi:hypothetical protein